MCAAADSAYTYDEGHREEGESENSHHVCPLEDPVVVVVPCMSSPALGNCIITSSTMGSSPKEEEDKEGMGEWGLEEGYRR